MAAILVSLTRSRVVVEGVGSIKGDFESARRAALRIPGATLQRSEVALYADGSEVLGPWETVNPRDVCDACPRSCEGCSELRSTCECYAHPSV